MGIKRIVSNKYTWIGAVAGMIAGPWALGTVGRLTGVNVSLPRIRGNG
jgi:hypothetical protein